MELKVDGRTVNAATGGRPFDQAKPAVIFIHGAGQDHTNWQLPARWFAWHGHAALAPDLPGHGRSDGPPLETIPAMAQWVIRLMDAAKVDKAALVGHSMGGGIVMKYAIAYPEDLLSITLVDTMSPYGYSGSKHRHLQTSHCTDNRR